MCVRGMRRVALEGPTRPDRCNTAPHQAPPTTTSAAERRPSPGPVDVQNGRLAPVPVPETEELDGNTLAVAQALRAAGGTK